MTCTRSRWLLVVLILALLAACGKHDDATSKASPNASANPATSVLTSVQLIRQGRLDALFRHVLPPDQYQLLRAKWKAKHAQMGRVSDNDRRKFAAGMARLTAPDADQQIWARIQPKLARMDKQAKARLPLMIGMGQIMMDTQISNAKQLSPDQKAQATGVVDAVGAWAQRTDWTDAGHIKQAIGVVTATARQLKLPTLDAAVALDYDQAMRKYTTVWNGLKRLLDVYGLSIDKTLDSATAKTLSSDGTTARVRVNYTLLGKPQHLVVDLVKIDHRWYDQDLLDRWNKLMHPAKAASAAPPASAAPVAQTAKASAK